MTNGEIHIRCDECGSEVDVDTCTECGLVIDNVNIVYNKHISRRREYDEKPHTFIGPLSPDIEYYHLYPKRAIEENLNRALKIQHRKREKNMDYYYFRSMKHIERICSCLKLPETILNEALLIIKSIINVKKTYFNSSVNGDCRELSAVKIACQINDYWINDKDFVSIARDFDGSNINLRNNKIKRKIDKDMMDIKKMLGLYIQYPKHPIFIDVACRRFGIPQRKITKLHDIYSRIRHVLNQSYKLEGYILALVYLNFNKDYKVTITRMEKEFDIARDTIRKRIKELLKMVYNSNKKGFVNHEM